MIKNISSNEEFEEEIKNGSILLDFYAEWCGPCKMLMPVIEGLEMTGELKDIKVLEIDIDKLPDITNKFAIRAVPTLFFIKDGKIISQKEGYLSKNELLSFISK